ncbi:hypothetical protein FRC17_000510 [Serendipita sp. 399]|nr:hypothetical protein FRC17_000510 [Serendipita sp. 399]
MSLASLVSRFIYGLPTSYDDQGVTEGQYEPIPQPPTIPLLGNTPQIDKILPYQSFRLLWKQYGEIIILQLPGRKIILANSHRLALEVLDESRFHKAVGGGLKELRGLVGDGLFTAYHGEPNWAIARESTSTNIQGKANGTRLLDRILTPAFSPANIKGMFGDMIDIASQLVLKWERYGPEYRINPAEDFTRLAFDTVSLCTMGYRVNSYYNDAIHPFVTAMGNYLLEAQRRTRLPELVKSMTSSAQWDADGATMNEVVTKGIGKQRGDLLDLMLNGKDPQTGETLSEENIRFQLLTFLIAGHETTSGMLSFITYELLKKPSAYARVREEVDTVLQGKPVQPEHLSKLPYIVAVMRESLRLHPPATIIGVTSPQDTVVLGKYFIQMNTVVTLQIAQIHRDPDVYGEDAEEFRPERMLDGKFEALPPKAWIPFGNGARACIGRAFAWQEAIIAIATLFQRFDFVLADSEYDLRLKQTLTIKPDEFYIHAIPRSGVAPMVLGAQQPVPKSLSPLASNTAPEHAEGRVGLNVLYGSNTGSSEAFAQRIASAAASKGFNARISTLDTASGHLSTTEPTVIVTASFEGQPADNAGRFVEELTLLTGSELNDVSYAVFGCGNRDWALTYQRIPRLIDEAMEKREAKRLLERGEGDASGADFFDSFDLWEEKLWKTLVEVYDTQPSEVAVEETLDIHVSGKGTERAMSLRQPDAALEKVVANYALTKDSAQEKRHIEFQLPENMTYSAGDYLAILPTNPAASVKRALQRFNLSEEATITINSSGSTTLPTGRPVELRQILSGYVELAQPASKRNIETLIDAAMGETKENLKKLAEQYKESIVEPRVSVLDLLYKYPDLEISLGTFITMLPAMRVRQYSISSSPLWNPTHATLTVSVISSPSLSGSGERFIGVASNFLANLKPGDMVQMMVRPSATAFSLPVDVSTPIVLFCAGTGLAPMRGFIQERALQIASGRKEIGKILLFFGCRDPRKDYLYGDTDLKEWVEIGAVDIRPAFSRASEKSEGCRYVQDRVLHDADDVRALFRQKAKFFTCGGTAVAAGIREACITLLEKGLDSREDAIEAFKRLQKERYATDIFG